MTASSLPLEGDLGRLHHRERCTHTPVPIAGAQLCRRRAHRALYDSSCPFVGTGRTPPWGTATVVSDPQPSSDTLARIHVWIRRRMRGAATPCWRNLTNHSWDY